MDLSAKIEAALFYTGEPTSSSELQKALESSKEEIEEGLRALEQRLRGRGVALVQKGDEYLLATAPEASSLIESMRRETFSRELGKAALETLSIILYKGPLTRPEIDYIRGVNSSFILRTLLIRGLIEKKTNPRDSRSFLYEASYDLLTHLGISKLSDLPEYDTVQKELDTAAEHPPYETHEQ